MAHTPQHTTDNSAQTMANIQALIDQVADAPGKHTQAEAAKHVEATFGAALKDFAHTLANTENVSIDIHIGPQKG